MKRDPLFVALDAFDLEGLLFVNFQTDAWLNGSARKVLEAEIRQNGDERIDGATVITALSSLRWHTLQHLKPWELESQRLAQRPELSARFAPYWEQNGGTHTPDELNRRPDWDFGEYVQENCTQSADGWDFGGNDGTSRAKLATSSPATGWSF